MSKKVLHLFVESKLIISIYSLSSVNKDRKSALVSFYFWWVGGD